MVDSKIFRRSVKPRTIIDINADNMINEYAQEYAKARDENLKKIPFKKIILEEEKNLKKRTIK